MCASRQERDGSPWGTGHYVGGDLGKRHDALSTDLLNRPDANPSLPRGGRLEHREETAKGNADQTGKNRDYRNE
jgi:hypothetical protein